MSRLASIVAVVLLSAGVAWGDTRGEVVSYHLPRLNGAIIIPVVPAGGFVLTDVVVQNGDASIFVYENGVPKLSFNIREPETISYHFESGIVFSAGTEVTLVIGVGRDVTFGGYIPCSNPCDVPVPTVGEWGTVFMMMLILIGGTVVFAKRFQNPTPVAEG